MPDLEHIPNFSKTDHVIDQYLDGTLPEPECSRIEERCLQNSRFFSRVQRRERLRNLLSNMILHRE
ncbi:MAG TPA: hypothetical protein PKN24_14245 [bacterium]|nr:hypothetical protein [bacterium]